jgi:biopolymer transport protein TolR
VRLNALPTQTACDPGFLLNGAQQTVADLTPLIDTIFQIILLLLVTLINSSIVRGFPVNLPTTSDNAPVQKDNEPVEVSVTREGRIYIADKTVGLAEVGPAVQAMIAPNPSQRVFVRADTDVSYGPVAQVLCRLSNSLPGREVMLVVSNTNQ